MIYGIIITKDESNNIKNINLAPFNSEVELEEGIKNLNINDIVPNDMFNTLEIWEHDTYDNISEKIFELSSKQKKDIENIIPFDNGANVINE